MNALHLILDCYFAVVLGVSGLAKLNQPEQFAATLHKQRLLPAWSIRFVSRFVPLTEICLSVLLGSGIFSIAIATLVFLAFVCFFLLEATLVLLKRNMECGCYGSAYRQSADAGSILTSLVLVVVSALHLWLAAHIVPLQASLRLLSMLPIVTYLGWCAVKVLRHRKAVQPNFNTGMAPASRLQVGDPVPSEFAVIVPERLLLLFVGYRCPHCVALCSTLREINLSQWSLTAIICGDPSPSEQSEGHFVFPSHARVMHDEQQDLLGALAIHAVPAALAFVNGRLVDQILGAHADWFASLSTRSVSLAYASQLQPSDELS